MSSTLPLQVTCPVLNNVVAGQSIPPIQIFAQGGTPPYRFSTSGLPPNLLCSTSGVITGIPQLASAGAQATQAFYGIRVTDATGLEVQASCQLWVLAQGLSAACPVQASPAIVGQPLVPISASASGGYGTYTFTGVGLPAGVALSSTGVLSGTPTIVGFAGYGVQVTSVAGGATVTATAQVDCMLQVRATPMVVTCPVVTAVLGQVLTPIQVVATGGLLPLTFSASGLPAGLNVSTGGLLTGRPMVGGAFSYRITVFDQTGQQAQVTCSLNVAVPVPKGALDAVVQTVPALQGVVEVEGGVQVLVASDNLVRLIGLWDETKNQYENGATAEFTLVDETGFSVAGPITLGYVTGSNGQYQGTLPASTALEVNTGYRLQVVATGPTGLVGHWNMPVLAIYREH